MFFDEMKHRNIWSPTIIGNHDVYYTNHNGVNSIELLLGEYSNVEILDKAQTKYIDNLPVCFVPWICDDNKEACLNEMKNTNALICMGHFPISGFVMHQGQVCEEGFDRNLFDKFDMTFSGHFHHRSSDGSIFYLGSPFEMTWADYNDPKGFHIFDTETLDLTFIPNPYKMFHRIAYDDINHRYSSNDDFSVYKDTYVKVVVKSKTDLPMFDRFLKHLYSVNPIAVNIVESFVDVSETKLDEEIKSGEDTLSILEKYVDTLEELDESKKQLKSMLRSTYMEALNVET